MAAVFGATEPLVGLMVGWMTEPVVIDGEIVPRDRGLPQGAPLSPLLANLFLDRFDEAMKALRLRVVRYADDFLVLAKTQQAAEEAHAHVETVLRQLGLRLDPAKSRVTSFDHGFRYLGFLFCRSLVLDVGPDAQALPAALQRSAGRSRFPVAHVAWKTLFCLKSRAIRRRSDPARIVGFQS